MKIKKIAGDYWIEIPHEDLKMMYRLEVRGKIAGIAMEEAYQAQHTIPTKSTPQPQIIDELEEIHHWGLMGGRAELLMDKIKRLITKYKAKGLIGD